MTNITELIPQRSPILMIDEFLGFDKQVSRSHLLVTDDNLFVDDGVLCECGIIEHIAQSAAARVGFIFKSKGEPIPLGYIGAVNSFNLMEYPKVGDEIFTEINVAQEFMNISLIEAQCNVNDNVVAQCKMKIFLEQ